MTNLLRILRFRVWRSRFRFYAVVDSITANCKVDKVQFSINGESDVTFRETMKLNQFYEEDLSYLEEKDT